MVSSVYCCYWDLSEEVESGNGRMELGRVEWLQREWKNQLFVRRKKGIKRSGIP